MRTIWWGVAMVITCTAVGLAAFAAGQRYALGILELEANYSTSLRIEAASRIRTGDVEGALQLMEIQIDSAIANTPPPRRRKVDWDRTLAQAKLYRTAVPSNGPLQTEIAAVLRDVRTDGDIYACQSPTGRIPATGAHGARRQTMS